MSYHSHIHHDIYQGEYVNDKTKGYGEYSHGNGAVYYGYWNDDMQFGIGYEIWEDTSQYSGEYFILMERRMELELIYGRMKRNIWENGKGII